MRAYGGIILDGVDVADDRVDVTMTGADDPVVPVVIRQPADTTITATEILQIIHGNTADKTFWLNEWGAPRCRIPSDKNGDSVFKGLYSTGYTGVPFQLIREEGATTYAFAVHADGSVSLAETVAPSSPPAGMHRLYPKVDGRWYSKNGSGVERLVAHAVETMPFSKGGALTTAAGTFRLYLATGYVFETIEVGVGTAPTGAAVLVDVNKNGTSIYTTQGNRPSISAAASRAVNAGRNTPDVATFAAGDYLTIDVDQVGSGTPGSDLTVALRLRAT